MSEHTIPWGRLVILGIAALFILGACAPKGTPEPTETATEAPAVVTEVAVEKETEEATAEGENTPEASEGAATTSSEEEKGYCEAAPLPELPVRPMDETDWFKGAEDAEITIYEYSDFQCPGCGGMYPVLDAFVKDHPNVRLVYRHFPLDFHDKAFVTAEATEAAGVQGKFWEMHNLLFDTKSEWEALSVEAAREKMSDYAEQLDLDVEKFTRELEEGTYVDKIQAQYDEARNLGLPGTPTFLFNNVLFPSDMGLSYNSLASFLGFLEVYDTLFFDAPPEMTTTEEDVFEATVKTTQGDIVVELTAESAPTYVNNFVFLADQDWYAGADFFFVQDDFVAVTGDPTNSSIGYPGYYCTGEENGVFNEAGLVGMLANGQFFFTLGADAAQLNDNYAFIGEITEGLDVLDALARRAVGDPTAPEADKLKSITVVKK